MRHSCVVAPHEKEVCTYYSVEGLFKVTRGRATVVKQGSTHLDALDLDDGKGGTLQQGQPGSGLDQDRANLAQVWTHTSEKKLLETSRVTLVLVYRRPLHRYKTKKQTNAKQSTPRIAG